MRRLIVLALLIWVSGCSGCDDKDPSIPPDAGPPDGPPVVEVVCEDLPPVATGTCAITPGGEKRLFKGVVLTPSTVYRGGQVLVEGEQITCVGCDCAAGGETVVSCPDGAISPGLINSHDHTQFSNSYPYGSKPIYNNDTAARYEDRQQWREGDGASYPRIRKSGTAGANHIAWGELRFVMGGATSIVGEGAATGLLRNLDKSGELQLGLSQPAVEFDTFPLDDFSSGVKRDGDCNYTGTPTTASTPAVMNADAYEPHISEGINATAHNEFLCQSSATFDSTPPDVSTDLIIGKTSIIHGIALTAQEYAQMSEKGTALIWSPRSNVSLYGDTARVTTASRMGVEIALGTDWMPSGSMNMLRELKCAASLNETYYDNFFTEEQLWRMVTSGAASVTASDDKIGTLAAGKVADISIFAAHGKSYGAVVSAESKDVAMVMRGGKVLYGDDAVVAGLSAEAASCDAVDVCGTPKKLCLMGEVGMTYTQLEAAAVVDGGAQPDFPAYKAFYCEETPPDEPTCTPSRPTSVAGSTTFTGVASATDSDGDGIADTEDNCVNVFNPARPMDNGEQPDTDTDGVGDACDACPLNADTNECANTVDPNDRDLDGVPNATDNCPDDANADQADGDTDGKGDVCDACAADSNPGTAGCPVSIYSIKNGTTPLGTAVHVDNALVTGVGSNGFFVQIVTGDTGFTTTDFSGLFVFTGTAPPVDVVAGKRVDIDGTVADFNGQIEIAPVSNVTVDPAAPVAAPTPVDATYAEVRTGGTRATTLESVLVSLPGATVSANNTMFGEYTLGTTPNELVADDFLFKPEPLPVAGQTFSAVTGILTRRNNASKIEPRSLADLPAGAAAIKTFGPALSFKRLASVPGATTPTALTVELTQNAPAGGTQIVLDSSNDAVATVPATVTVAAGTSSIVVPVTAVTASATPVTIMATLGVQNLTAEVRVLGLTEGPTTVTIAPTEAGVAQGGTVAMSVTFDLPPPANTNVALSIIQGSGTVPANVTVTAEKTTATFNFVHVSGDTVKVRATFGGSTSDATITLSTGANHLVINEVDYDQAATDMTEFIEIFNPSAQAQPLADLQVLLINGSGGTVYKTIDLATAGTSLAPGQYLVIAGSGITVGSGVLKISGGFNTDAIQNGAPDGIVLINNATHTLIDGFSYEGAMPAIDLPGFTAAVDLADIGAGDLTPFTNAVCRKPNGTDTDAAADWGLCTPSAGADNP